MCRQDSFVFLSSKLCGNFSVLYVIETYVDGMCIGFFDEDKLALHDILSGKESSTAIIFGLVDFDRSKILQDI